MSFKISDSNFRTGTGLVPIQNVDIVISKQRVVLALFDLVKKEWIPHAPRATLAPLAALQPVAPVLEGDVSLASLSKLITQMEGRMMCPFDLVDERVDILEYSVELLQDDAEDDVDGGDTALET
ncbi:hypothetical protein V6N12_007849 [Hibiscus sabdariffa]|uniref:Uncharacterized protein n=1 Tax=Hibiscus sabdariffa TaxID=183260 RepID=A0ABR2F2Z1_9ROSI